MKRAGYDMDAGAKRLQDLLDKQKKEREEREMNSTKSEEASPMIKPPKNEFAKKEDAFAHAKQHGGKVMKKTFIHPTSGMKTVSYVVKEETELDEAIKKPNATTRFLRQYPVSDKDVAKPVKKPEKKKPEQGVAEGTGKNVVKSVKVGNFRHDLVDTGMGWQVRIYNGDELYDTGMSKNSEQKGLAALEDAVAYTEKQTRTKRQGVSEGEGKTQKYEMMMRNGQVKKFIAKDDADAKRIAAGHGAKSVIRLRGGIPAGKVSEQGVSEAGPFSYGAKPPRKGSVAYNALMKRKEQDKNRVKEIEAIGTKNHHIGVAKVTKEDIEDVTEAKDDMYKYIDQSGGQVIKGKSGTYVGYTHSATKGKGANILKHHDTKKYYAAGGSSTAFTQKTTLHDTPQAAAKAYHKGNLAESTETAEHHFEKSLEHYHQADKALKAGDREKYDYHVAMGDVHKDKVDQHASKADFKNASPYHTMSSHLFKHQQKHREIQRNQAWEDEKNQSIQRGHEFMKRAGEHSKFEMKDGKLHRKPPKYDKNTGKKLKEQNEKENFIFEEEERKSEFNDPHRNTIMYHAEHVHKNLHHAEALNKVGDKEGAKMHLSTAMMHMDQLNKRVGEHGKNHFGHFIERASKASQSIHGYDHKITKDLRKQKEDYLKESLNYGKSFKDLREAAFNSNCCPDEEYGFTEEQFTVTGNEQYEDWGDDIVEGKLSFSKLSQKLHEEDGKNVKLNKPFLTPGGPKKRAVYVKNDKGNTVKVNFGDPNLEIKRDDPERKSSFRARHNCDNPGPKWKARYWSCKFWSSTPVSKL